MDDAWKQTYYDQFRDDRAIEETLTMMHEQEHIQTSYLPLINDLDLSLIHIYHLQILLIGRRAMLRMKKKFGLLLVAALASFALVGCGDSASSYKELTSYTNEDSQEVTISNSSLELTVDKDTTTFVLKDKKNGKEMCIRDSLQTARELPSVQMWVLPTTNQRHCRFRKKVMQNLK